MPSIFPPIWSRWRYRENPVWRVRKRWWSMFIRTMPIWWFPSGQVSVLGQSSIVNWRRWMPSFLWNVAKKQWRDAIRCLQSEGSQPLLEVSYSSLPDGLWCPGGPILRSQTIWEAKRWELSDLRWFMVGCEERLPIVAQQEHLRAPESDEGQHKAFAPDDPKRQSRYSALWHHLLERWCGGFLGRDEESDSIGLELRSAVSHSGTPTWVVSSLEFEQNPKNPAIQELQTRWMQWGTFMPLMRNHCSSPMVSELYEFGKQGRRAYDAMIKAIKLRYRLLPYIYSTAGDCVQNSGKHDAPR